MFGRLHSRDSSSQDEKTSDMVSFLSAGTGRDRDEFLSLSSSAFSVSDKTAETPRMRPRSKRMRIAGKVELSQVREDLAQRCVDQDTVCQEELASFISFLVQRNELCNSLLRPIEKYSSATLFSWKLLMDVINEGAEDDNAVEILDLALANAENPFAKILDVFKKQIKTGATVTKEEMDQCISIGLATCGLEHYGGNLTDSYENDVIFDWKEFLTVLETLGGNVEPYEALKCGLHNSKKELVDQQVEWALKCSRQAIGSLQLFLDSSSRHAMRLQVTCSQFMTDPMADIFHVWETRNLENVRGPKEPIVDVGILRYSRTNNKPPKGYELLEFTDLGNSGILNTTGSGNLMMYVQRSFDKPPITALALYETPKESEPHGFTPVIRTARGESAELSQGMRGAKMFLAVKRGDGAPIFDIQIVSKRKNEPKQKDFHEILRSPFKQRKIQLDNGFTQITYALDFMPIVRKCKDYADRIANGDNRSVVNLVLARCTFILIAGLHTLDREVFIRSLEAFTYLDHIEKFPEELLSLFIESVYNTQNCLLSICGSETFEKLFKWLNHVFEKRLKDISPSSFICLIQIATLYRHEDMKQRLIEKFIEGICKKIKYRRRKEAKNRAVLEKKQAKQLQNITEHELGGAHVPRLKNTSSRPVTSIDVVEATMKDLISRVSNTAAVEPLLKLFKRKHNMDMELRDTLDRELRKMFIYRFDRLAVAALVAFSMICNDDLPPGVHENELTRRRNWALRHTQMLLSSARDFFVKSDIAGTFARQIFGFSFLSSCLSSHPNVIIPCGGMIAILWSEYKEIMKFELGVYLQMGIIDAIKCESATCQLKMDMIGMLEEIFTNPGQDIIDLYYNYDNELDWPICVNMCEVLTEISMELDGELSLKALQTLGHFLEAVAIFLGVPGLENEAQDMMFETIFKTMKSTDNFHEDSETSQMLTSRLTMTQTGALRYALANNDPMMMQSEEQLMMFSLDDHNPFDSNYNMSLRFSKRPIMKRRTSWGTRIDERQKQRQVVDDALLMARQEKLKNGVRHLIRNGGAQWGSLQGIAMFLFEYKDQLDHQELTEFLGARKSSVFTEDQHEELRDSWANFLDLTNMDFEKAWRHFLTDCGLILAGIEVAITERILEFFAQIYVRYNPGIFRSDVPAFQLAFALFMIQSEQTKVVQNPMSQHDFIYMLRGADCPLGDDLLSQYYISISTNPLEVGGQKSMGKTSQQMHEHFYHDRVGTRCQARARLGRFVKNHRTFRSCDDRMVVRGMYNSVWGFLTPLTMHFRNPTLTADFLGALLDVVKSAASTLVRLRMNEEADSFISPVSELYYRQENDTLTEQELTTGIVSGRHRHQFAFTELHKLMEMPIDDYEASCHHLVGIINTVKFRITYDDQQKKLRSLEADLNNVVQLINSERRFIDTVNLRKLARNQSQIERTLVLFNDVLIYGQLKGGGEIDHHRTIHLSFCSIQEIPDYFYQGVRYAFEVVSPQKGIICVCDTQEQKNHWKKLIRDAIGECLEARELWMQDNESMHKEAVQKSQYVGRSVQPLEFELRRADPLLRRPVPCKLCLRPFGFWNSRVLCPLCQQHACSKHCTKHKLQIPQKRGRAKNQKVCDGCYGLAKGMDGSNQIRKATGSDTLVPPGNRSSRVSYSQSKSSFRS